ncbi:cysteine-rich CWC family protein [Polaromonas sp. AET17H-212]|uniref:cysteine-rich CWC family protein n=1 Tax=Polaromonas sp. AET17H-212 TaxID=1977061 RepID=UPI000BBC9367|nr:cysteine-rich CWC family protein [Polaromonas sp. AET17H-212]
MTATGASVPTNSSCPRCGATFRCGMVGGDAECWCVKLPHIMPVPPGSPSTIVENSKNHDRQLTTVRPELVEGLRQAQPERYGVVNDENIHSTAEASCFCPACLQKITDDRQQNTSSARD